MLTRFILLATAIPTPSKGFGLKLRTISKVIILSVYGIEQKAFSAFNASVNKLKNALL
jgi:hypothetical protein